MITWTCKQTKDGLIIEWSSSCELHAGESIAFYAGLDRSNLELLFTSENSSGSNVLNLSGLNAPNINASGRLDIIKNSETTRIGRTLPIVAGFTVKQLNMLNKFYEDFINAVRAHNGETGQIYRRYFLDTPCPDCCDPATGAQLRHNCTTCGGAGRQSGWSGPYPVYLLWVKHFGSTLENSGTGTLHEASSQVARLSAFPRPLTDDRILLSSSRLYIVGAPQQTVVGISGVPAVIECPLKQPDPDTAAAYIPDSWLT